MRLTIPGFPLYQVDEMGNVYSPKWKLKPCLNEKGYLRVFLRRDGRTFTRYVHRLVCEAFHGPAPSNQHEAAHANGVRADCTASNLSWKTKAENESDKIAHGTLLYGERVGGARLTAALVEEARRRALAGEQVADIAVEFGVNCHTLGDAVMGRRWGRIGTPVPKYHTRRRFSEDQVREIRTRAERGETYVAIARDYGVTWGAIRAINVRESYSHVE